MKTNMILGLLASTMLCAANIASAQNVNLTSDDGTIDLVGSLVEVDDVSYVIDTDMGLLRVKRDFVDCAGQGCPTAEGADPYVVSWDVSLWGEPRAATAHIEKLADVLSTQTDGKFTLNLSYGGLAERDENIDGIAAGAFDMAQICVGDHPKKTPALTILELPFLGVASLEKEIEVSQTIYAQPAIQEEMARWNATILMPTPQPQINIVGTGTPPSSLYAFTDLRIGATGTTRNAIKAMGAEPVDVSTLEIKAALGSGDIAAAALTPDAHLASGTIENATWWTTNLNPGSSNCPVIANTDSLAALPEEYRDLITTATRDALDHYVADYNHETMAVWGPTLRDHDIDLLTVNNVVLNDIYQSVSTPAAVKWITRYTSKGIPARDLYGVLMAALRN